MVQIRAFSLLELMMVLMIMGMAAAIAMPRYAESMARYRAAAAAQRLEADLEWARERAKLISENVTITVDVEANTLVIAALAGLDDPSRAYVTDLNNQPYQADIVAATFGGETDVVFDGYGAPGSGGTIVVRAGEVTMNVVLNADTGEVEIQ